MKRQTSTAANIARGEVTGEDPEVVPLLDVPSKKARTVIVTNPKTGQVYTVVN